jgi:hypothetical protein
MKLVLVALVLVADSAASVKQEDLFLSGSYGRSPAIYVSKPPDMRRSEYKYHLEYLALRGLADFSAFLLEYSGVTYEAHYYGRKEFAEEIEPHARLLFGRLPLLTDSSGTRARHNPCFSDSSH